MLNVLNEDCCYKWSVMAWSVMAWSVMAWSVMAWSSMHRLPLYGFICRFILAVISSQSQPSFMYVLDKVVHREVIDPIFVFKSMVNTIRSILVHHQGLGVFDQPPYKRTDSTVAVRNRSLILRDRQYRCVHNVQIDMLSTCMLNLTCII